MYCIIACIYSFTYLFIAYGFLIVSRVQFIYKYLRCLGGYLIYIYIYIYIYIIYIYIYIYIYGFNGLPKMRPILSAIGTVSYCLAKFLFPILAPITNGPFSIINSFDFNKELLDQNASLVMDSLDVDALFTSIPLDETINIGVNELFKNSNEISKLSKTDVHDLLNLATKESLFLFDGEYYYQTDGVAMGSPLGPTLANLFMSYHEQIWLDECPLEFKPKFYRRYVDDIFILGENIEHIVKFKEYLNSKHQNINFTSELECNGKSPFLDNLIDR